MMRTHRLVLLERLQPLRDFLLRRRAVALQQVYESGLTWQPNVRVVKSIRLHLWVQLGGTKAHLRAQKRRGFPPLCFKSEFPGSPPELGKQVAAGGLGVAGRFPIVTPSCSPKTPPSRRDLFVTCFASEPSTSGRIRAPEKLNSWSKYFGFYQI